MPPAKEAGKARGGARGAKLAAPRRATAKVDAVPVVVERRSRERRSAKAVPSSPAPLVVERRTRQRRATAAVSPVAVPVATLEPLPELVVATADPSMARMLDFALDQVDLAHRLFSSGPAVLERLLVMPIGQRAPIVLLDVDLPGVDGHAILERLGVARPDTFLIIVLSSHADESVQVRSLLAGAVDHIAKPFNIRILVAKLLRWAAMSGRHFMVR